MVSAAGYQFDAEALLPLPQPLHKFPQICRRRFRIRIFPEELTEASASHWLATSQDQMGRERKSLRRDRDQLALIIQQPGRSE
jgi:hypothetical protein